MKKTPIRVRHEGNGSWRVSGDIGPGRTISMPWGGWNRMYSVMRLFENLKRSPQPVVYESGKKEKKFWRKVQRRIDRLAPRS
jgi:hypothetical protein